MLAVAALSRDHWTIGSHHDGAAAAKKKKWALEDAICRGHILATPSDRISPDHIYHTTTVVCTYDLDMCRVTRQLFEPLRVGRQLAVPRADHARRGSG